jgi:hypothetical protein
LRKGHISGGFLSQFGRIYLGFEKEQYEMSEQEPKQKTGFPDYHSASRQLPTLRKRFGAPGDFLAGAIVGVVLSLLGTGLGSIYGLLWIVGPIGPAVALANVKPLRQGNFLFFGAAILYGFYFIVPRIVSPKSRLMVVVSLAIIHLSSAFYMTSLGR